MSFTTRWVVTSPSPRSAPSPGAGVTWWWVLRVAPFRRCPYLPLLKGASLVGVFWGEFAKREPKANAAMMQTLAQWYGQSLVKPLIHQTLPMSDLKQAYAQMSPRSVMGKLVMVN